MNKVDATPRNKNGHSATMIENYLALDPGFVEYHFQTSLYRGDYKVYSLGAVGEWIDGCEGQISIRCYKNLEKCKKR